MEHTEFVLTSEQQRRLSLVARHGADQVGRSMSRWLRETVTVTIRSVEVVHYSDVTARLCQPDATLAAVMVGVSKGISGTTLFLFDEPSALEIVRRVLDRDTAPTEWDELSRSAMEETGNIVGSAFLNGLALALNMEVQPESPMFVVDFGEAILDQIVIEMAMTGEYALLFEAEIASASGDVTGQFTLLPDAECFQRLVNSV